MCVYIYIFGGISTTIPMRSTNPFRSPFVRRLLRSRYILHKIQPFVRNGHRHHEDEKSDGYAKANSFITHHDVVNRTDEFGSSILSWVIGIHGYDTFEVTDSKFRK